MDNLMLATFPSPRRFVLYWHEALPSPQYHHHTQNHPEPQVVWRVWVIMCSSSHEALYSTYLRAFVDSNTRLRALDMYL